MHVRTVNGEAKAGKDFTAIDQELNFKSGQLENEVQVAIVDDDEWEPDEDFYVELYDKGTGNRLVGEDVRTRVTILDDDKPGMLVFEEKKSLRHPANERKCVVVVNRVQGTDGTISVKYKTVEIDKTVNTATPGVDFIHTEGTLEFKHQHAKEEIEIMIPERPVVEGEKPHEGGMFGVKLYEPHPAAVKVSKKDMLIVEIVQDAETKKQSEALQQLLERINREEKITWG